MIQPWIAWRLALATRRHRAVALGAALVVLLSGCSQGSAHPIAGNLTVGLRDFAIDLSRTHFESGRITIDLTNLGPTTHEFNLDRTDLAPDNLPKTLDGLTVDEDAPSLHRITSIEGVPLGAHRHVTLNLAPGHYVVYCNLEGHYLGSMHAEIFVSGTGAAS